MNNIYEAKNRYSGSTVDNYINKRKSQKWDTEQSIFQKTFLELGEKLKIIDIPAGTGRFFEFYDSLNYDVTAMDISNDMLQMAKKNAPKNLNVHYQIGDAESLMFSENNFDCVVSARFLNWLPVSTYYKVLDEFKRITGKHLLMQVRLKEKAKITEILNDLVNNFKFRKVKRSIIKAFLRKSNYADYFVHSYHDTMEYINASFKLVSIQEIDIRYKYSKLEKHTFFLIHCIKK